jgi:AcrR family transcriptional regulator
MSLRAKQRERGREVIRDAAEVLFLANGYSRTPVTEVAKSAGVAEKTVYSLFDTKSGLLLDLFGVRVAGENEALLAERHKKVDELVDAEEIIDEFCRINQEVAERVLPLLRVVIEASALDSDVADRLATQEEFRQRDQEYVLDVLDRRGHLRNDQSREELARSLWLAASPELVIKALDAGWTLEQHTSWLRQVLLALLLPR